MHTYTALPEVFGDDEVHVLGGIEVIDLARRTRTLYRSRSDALLMVREILERNQRERTLRVHPFWQRLDHQQ